MIASNPELDPHNVLTGNKGVIGDADDVDVFSFVAGAGTVSLTLTPAWDAFYRSTSRRVITSYSIHYTKLYDAWLRKPRTQT